MKYAAQHMKRNFHQFQNVRCLKINIAEYCLIPHTVLLKDLIITVFQEISWFHSSQSQSHIATDGQSVSQYVLVSNPNLGLSTRDFFFKITVLSFGGALSDERSGLSCVSLCH
jgi:hypothetical protein